MFLYEEDTPIQKNRNLSNEQELNKKDDIMVINKGDKQLENHSMFVQQGNGNFQRRQNRRAHTRATQEEESTQSHQIPRANNIKRQTVNLNDNLQNDNLSTIFCRMREQPVLEKDIEELQKIMERNQTGATNQIFEPGMNRFKDEDDLPVLEKYEGKKIIYKDCNRKDTQENLKLKDLPNTEVINIKERKKSEKIVFSDDSEPESNPKLKEHKKTTKNSNNDVELEKKKDKKDLNDKFSFSEDDDDDDDEEKKEKEISEQMQEEINKKQQQEKENDEKCQVLTQREKGDNEEEKEQEQQQQGQQALQSSQNLKKNPLANFKILTQQMLPNKTEESMRNFLSTPIVKGHILQCYVKRENSFFNPKFHLYLSDGNHLLMSARKMGGNTSTNIMIIQQPRDGKTKLDKFKKDSESFIGKLKANFYGNQYFVYDSGINPGRTNESEIYRRELAYLVYENGILQGNNPTKMKCLIPEVDPKTHCHVKEYYGDQSLSNKYKNNNFEDTQFFYTKPPMYDSKKKTYYLDFGPRVQKTSVKNYQLIDDKDDNMIYFTSGKTNIDEQFVMDIVFPFSPLQAFGIMLSGLVVSQ